LPFQNFFKIPVIDGIKSILFHIIILFKYKLIFILTLHHLPLESMVTAIAIGGWTFLQIKFCKKPPPPKKTLQFSKRSLPSLALAVGVFFFAKK
jgi:heme O synthase-like polyprenyltransferase